jgi:hypothetical protein
MVKALKELTGHSTQDMSMLISEILEEGIKSRIAYEIGYNEKKKSGDSYLKTLESAISSDLGDYEPEVEKEEETGITDVMLDKDLEVADRYMKQSRSRTFCRVSLHMIMRLSTETKPPVKTKASRLTQERQ